MKLTETSDDAELMPANAFNGQLENASAPDIISPSPQATQTSDQLAKQLRDHVVHTDHRTAFLPLDALDIILAKENNLAALQSCTGASGADGDIISYRAVQDFVWKNGTSPSWSSGTAEAQGSKILAILLLIGKPQMIRRFIREKLTDKDLPFQFTKNGDTCDAKTRNGQEIKQVFFDWEYYMDVVSFNTQQWTVLPPFFRKPDNMNGGHVHHHDLPEDSVLPFKRSEERSLNICSGNYGTVFKVQIHPAHCNFDRSGNPDLIFGVKRLKDKSEGAFRKEVDTLERFSINTNRHLIQLLGTYKHRHSYYLIFPWADKNLQGLWKSIEKPQHTRKLSLWVARQCHGLAVGLSKIHVCQQNDGLLPLEKPFGRHNDIKHENVLWFKDKSKNAEEYDGELKISDFGLVKFNSEGSRYMISKDSFFTPTYMPPECALPNHVISRSLDLWSLGCMYLEFVTWLLKGFTAATEEFTDSRNADSHSWVLDFCEDNFFTIKNNEASLKSSVIKCIEGLHKDSQCTAYLHDFLDCITNDLLVPNPTDRTSCIDLVTKLGKIVERCETNPDYCIRGEPRNNHLISLTHYIPKSPPHLIRSVTVTGCFSTQETPSFGRQTPGASVQRNTEHEVTQSTASEANEVHSVTRMSEGVTEVEGPVPIAKRGREPERDVIDGQPKKKRQRSI